MQIVTSWMEEGIEIGLERGKLQLLLPQLTRRFGELQSEVEDKISTLTPTQLDALGLEMLDFESWEDLTAWLAKVEEQGEEEESDRSDEEE